MFPVGPCRPVYTHNKKTLIKNIKCFSNTGLPLGRNLGWGETSAAL